MAVPISEIGSAISYPCSEHELFSMIQDVPGKEFPIGGILLYTKTVADLPARFVIANGTANASGSGIDAISPEGGRFIRCVVTDGLSGNLTAATPISPASDQHQHEIVTDSRVVRGKASLEPVDVIVDGDGAHEHDGKALDSTVIDQLGGLHTHEGKTTSEPADVLEAGNHRHPGMVSEEMIDPHSCDDIVACIDNEHPDHRHPIDITVDGEHSHDGGPPGLIELESPTGINIPNDLFHNATAGLLEHEDHDHPLVIKFDGEHDHPAFEHDHALELELVGWHQHGSLPHDHNVTVESGGSHGHSVDTGIHQHDIIMDAHYHQGTTDQTGGDHTHTASEPSNMQLMPIERIS